MSWNLVVIDDDEVDLEHLRRAVRRGGDGSCLWVAKDGIDGIALLKSGEIPAEGRVLLLDLNMPRMNGLECLRRIRADAALRDTRVVVLTTSSDDRDSTAANALGVLGYLVKPIVLSELLTMLQAK